MPSVLTVQAFGPVGATLDGVPLDLGGPRQRAVLGVLVAAGRRTVSTDRFLDELWSGEPPPSAAGALQAYVSRLRAATEPHRQKRRPAAVVVSSPPGYVLQLPDDAVDTWRFGALVREGADLARADDAQATTLLERALALWTDEPFAAYAEQEWAATERTRLHDLRAEALELHATLALRQGGGGRVLAGLEAHVRDHPLREQGVALLARVLYQGGRQAEALAALAGLRARLVEELGVDPGPEVRALEADILRQAEHLSAPRPTPVLATRPEAVAPGPAPSQLVGREDELARLELAAGSLGSRAGVVWVEGEAGFGKSALVQEFADRSVTRWAVARGHCSEVLGTPPGAVWREVLEDLEDPDADGPQETAEPGAYGLAVRVATRVRVRAAPTLVVLEDLHRADDQSLQVLRHLLETVRAPLLVLATFRSHEVDRDLAAALALTAERTLDRVRLRGLPDDEAAALLVQHVSAELSPAAGARLAARAGGNPLFLRQLARLVDAEGAEVAAEVVPSAIRDLLTRRIERLPVPVVETLSRAAVLGRELDLDLLVALEERWGEIEESALTDHLDLGLVAGLLDSPRPGELQFAHALVRDTFYGRLPPLRRVRLHRTAVEALEQVAPARLEEIAHHTVASLDRGSAAPALPRLRRAARAAGPAAAAGHLRAALRAVELAEGGFARRHEVRLDLVRALARSGDTAGALAERELAVVDAEQHGDAADRARAWQWHAPVIWTRSPAVTDPARVARIQSLLGQVSEPGLAADLHSALAMEADPWDMALSAAAGRQAVAAAERAGDAETLCLALNARYGGTFVERDAGLLPLLARRLLGVAEEHRLLGYVALAHVMLHSVAVGEAELATAAEHVRAAVSAGTSGQLPELVLMATVHEAAERLLAGDLAASAERFEEVLAAVAAGGDPNSRNIGLWVRFTLGFVAGDTSHLAEDAARMTRDLPWHSTDLHVATLLDAGDVAGARARWSPVPLQRDATWLYDSVLRTYLAHRLGDHETAAAMHDELLPWAGTLSRTLNGALSLGPVDYYLAMAAAAGGDAAAATHHLEAGQRLTVAGRAEAFAPGWVRLPGGLGGP